MFADLLAGPFNLNITCITLRKFKPNQHETGGPEYANVLVIMSSKKTHNKNCVYAYSRVFGVVTSLIQRLPVFRVFGS